MKNIFFLVIWLSVTFSAVHAQDNRKKNNDTERKFEIGGASISAGETYRGTLKVPSGEDNVETFIPVTVHHGSNSGPVLSLISGIHGSEYAPILSMQRLAGLIDPRQLSGTLIIVHVANIPAFTARTIYLSPNDLKNLNRAFPGNVNGTVTERIASTLKTEVILRSDYVVDIHAGDANEGLRPSYTAYYAEAGGQEVIDESKRIAIAFGLGTIVEFSGSYQSVDDAIYTSAQAVTLGIPAIDIESGELGKTDDQYITPIIDGAQNIMRELKMIEGDLNLPEYPLFINDRALVYSSHDGIFYADPKVKTGDYISKGTQLGVITDYHGTELETVEAPSAGILLILFRTPPVNAGDNIAVIGKISEF
jgi:predicted deacylase